MRRRHVEPKASRLPFTAKERQRLRRMRSRAVHRAHARDPWVYQWIDQLLDDAAASFHAIGSAIAPLVEKCVDAFRTALGIPSPSEQTLEEWPRWEWEDMSDEQ